MGKIIGVLNQKGGVGKSTLVSHISLALHTKYNYERKNNFVCVYDTDNPQYSVSNLRKEELRVLKSKVEAGNTYYETKYKNEYKNLQPLSIYNGSIIEAIESLETLKENFDYTFVDVVGTLNTEGYNYEFVSNFDYVIIPMTNKYEEVRSTAEFAKNIIYPIYENKGIDGYGIILNNVKIKQSKHYLEIKNSLAEKGFSMLDSIINHNDKYVTPYLHSGKGTLSTLFSKYDKSIYNLIEELLTKI